MYPEHTINLLHENSENKKMVGGSYLQACYGDKIKKNFEWPQKNIQKN